MRWNDELKMPEWDHSMSSERHGPVPGHWDKQFYDGKFLYACSNCGHLEERPVSRCPICGQFNDTVW